MQRALRQRVAKRAASPDPEIEDDDEDEPPSRRSRSGRPRRRRQRTSAREALQEGEEEEGDEGEEPRQLVQGKAWLPAEDELLRCAVDKHGKQWGKICNEMFRAGWPRSSAMCRNRLARMDALLKPGVKGRNHCKKCGQVKRGHTCTALVALEPAAVAAAANRAPQPRGVGPGADLVNVQLADHSIVPRAGGNNFNVDMADFFAHTCGDEDTFLGSDENMSMFDSLSLTMTINNIDSLPVSTSGVSLGSIGKATPAPANTGSNDPSPYLTSAAPPPISSKILHTSRVPLPDGTLVTTALVDTIDYLELSELHEAAKDALASKSFASFGATPPSTTPRATDAVPVTSALDELAVGSSRVENETPTADFELAATQRLLRTPPLNQPEHPFDQPLRAESPMASLSPIEWSTPSTPYARTSYGAPPLMTVASFSRAQSFTWAESIQASPDDAQAPILRAPPPPPARSAGSASK